MTMTTTGPPAENTPTPGARLPPQDAAAFVQSDAGDIRIGPILAIPQVLQDLGARPQTAFARAGVRLSLFRDPDARLPLEVAGRLFFESARLADCPHFALLVGERFSLDGLGPLGELMRHSPNVGAALRSLLLHLQLHDRGAAPLLLQTERNTVGARLFGVPAFHAGRRVHLRRGGDHRAPYPAGSLRARLRSPDGAVLVPSTGAHHGLPPAVSARR
jgi:hypothetical protein